MTRKKFLFNLSRASYQKKWGKKYQEPTAGEKFLAFLTRLIPKIGPLRVLEMKTPTPETERMFEASFNATLDHYRQFLTQAGAGHLELPNDNFDTGSITGPGKYGLNDEAQAKWLQALSDQSFRGTSPEIRAELLKFFGDPDAAYAVKKDPKKWANVQAQIVLLKNAGPSE